MYPAQTSYRIKCYPRSKSLNGSEKFFGAGIMRQHLRHWKVFHVFRQLWCTKQVKRIKRNLDCNESRSKLGDIRSEVLATCRHKTTTTEQVATLLEKVLVAQGQQPSSPWPARRTLGPCACRNDHVSWLTPPEPQIPHLEGFFLFLFRTFAFQIFLFGFLGRIWLPILQIHSLSCRGHHALWQAKR